MPFHRQRRAFRVLLCAATPADGATQGAADCKQHAPSMLGCCGLCDGKSRQTAAEHSRTDGAMSRMNCCSVRTTSIRQLHCRLAAGSFMVPASDVELAGLPAACLQAAPNLVDACYAAHRSRRAVEPIHVRVRYCAASILVSRPVGTMRTTAGKHARRARCVRTPRRTAGSGTLCRVAGPGSLKKAPPLLRVRHAASWASAGSCRIAPHCTAAAAGAHNVRACICAAAALTGGEEAIMTVVHVGWARRIAPPRGSTTGSCCRGPCFRSMPRLGQVGTPAALEGRARAAALAGSAVRRVRSAAVSDIHGHHDNLSELRVMLEADVHGVRLHAVQAPGMASGTSMPGPCFDARKHVRTSRLQSACADRGPSYLRGSSTAICSGVKRGDQWLSTSDAIAENQAECRDVDCVRGTYLRSARLYRVAD